MPETVEKMVGKTCCGEEVATRFCPHCGAEAGGHDLMTLLAHCRHAVAQAEARYADSKARKNERSMRIKAAPLRKWSAWVAALESVVGK